MTPAGFGTGTALALDGRADDGIDTTPPGGIGDREAGVGGALLGTASSAMWMLL